MKKNLILLLTLFSLSGFAQSTAFTSLRKAIHEQHPELDLDDKLIAFNVWSLEDNNSRAANQSFEKAATVYGHARLKGGLRGIIVVSVNTNDMSTDATIALNKDGVTHLLAMKLSDLESLGREKDKNAVYDALGNKVYKDLQPSEIYPAINKLITR